MAVDWKLVVDCSDPLQLARFWALALGYEVEDNSVLIDQLLASGAVGRNDFTVVDGRKAWRLLAAVRHPDDPVDEASGTGLGRRLLFQAVPEAKQAKNRLHIDLHVGPEQRDSEVRRLTEIGAKVLHKVEAQGSNHVTMADPEGNEFDVQ
ncbi:VOC family protein [Streptomyces ovatisporus]|uniref:VOC family protein n=1 Tax=Streptomyces ovatisporus TaxID=1128682 RepID=A0ABV9A7E1_9ACTN